MISDFFYNWLGDPRPATGVPGVEEGTLIYQRDPYFPLLIMFPFWVALFFWGVAGLFGSVALIGLTGIFGTLNQTAFWTITSISGIVGTLFFTWSYVVFQNYLATIPVPDVAQRQAFTKRPRHLVNGFVFIPWLNMKGKILPGSYRLKASAESPTSTEGHKIEVWVKQENGGSDKQFIKLLVNYSLDVKELPLTVQRAFDDQFMSHRLERAPGNSWLSRIQHAKDGVMKEIDDEVIARLAGMADALFATETMENLVKDREGVNVRLAPIAQKKMRKEYGVNILSLSVEDVQDAANVTNGWIYNYTRASQAEQKAKADIAATNAETNAATLQAEARKTSRIAIAAANLAARTEELAADTAVATAQQTTLTAQVQVAKLEAEKQLQIVAERLKTMKQGDMADVLKNLLYVDDPQQAAALATQIKDFLKVPGTLTLVGDLKIGELVDSFVKLLTQLANKTP